MMAVLVLATYAAYLAYDFKAVAKSNRRWRFWPLLALFGAGLAVQMLFELGVSIPSPAKPISELVSGLFGLE